MEFFVAERSFAGVFPTHDGQACIWVGTPSADAKAARRRAGSREEAFGELLARSAPQLAERLRHARRASPVQGMLRQPNQVRQAFGPGWALVGDAGYHRDAITAHGISDAFRDAEFLAVALDQVLSAGAEESTALARYQQQRDQALGEIFDITCRLAAYPPVPAFIELQKQLSAAIDKQAAALAARPVPGEFLLATA
jgi:flavin-dependent dehydrogenase